MKVRYGRCTLIPAGGTAVTRPSAKGLRSIGFGVEVGVVEVGNLTALSVTGSSRPSPMHLKMTRIPASPPRTDARQTKKPARGGAGRCAARRTTGPFRGPGRPPRVGRPGRDKRRYRGYSAIAVPGQSRGKWDVCHRKNGRCGFRGAPPRAPRAVAPFRAGNAAQRVETDPLPGNVRPLASPKGTKFW